MRERKRASSTSRAGSRNSEANGDGPVPSALTISRRRNGAASGDARSMPKSGKMSPAWTLNSSIISRNAWPSPGWSRSASATLASRSRKKTALWPSGSETPVGLSVFR